MSVAALAAFLDPPSGGRWSGLELQLIRQRPPPKGLGATAPGHVAIAARAPRWAGVVQDALQRAVQDAEDRAARTRREAVAEAAEAARQVGEAKGQLAALRGQLEAAREDAALAASSAHPRCLRTPCPPPPRCTERPAGSWGGWRSHAICERLSCCLF